MTVHVFSAAASVCASTVICISIALMLLLASNPARNPSSHLFVSIWTAAINECCGHQAIDLLTTGM
jgi:hypothetical protein